MARDVRAGKAYIEMYLKDDKLSQGLRQARRSLTRVKVGIAAVGSAFTAMAGIASGVAVVAIKKATDAAGDFAETVAKFETVFGRMSPQVREWGEELSKTLGVSRREILSTLSGLQDLFVPLGIEEGAAAEMSKQLTQLAVDLASFNNLQVADVVRDLQAAMTGSSETMKKYGVVVDEAAVKQRLLNMGLDPKTATHAEKVMARLAITMDMTKAAQGDAARTADSYNNQLKRFDSQVEVISQTLGQKFLPVMSDVMVIVNAAVNDLAKWAERIIPAIQGIEEAALRAAQSGNWNKVGEIIGMQVELGFRKTLGDSLVNLIKLGAKTSSGVGLLATGPGRFASDVAYRASSRGYQLQNEFARRMATPELDLFSRQAAPPSTTATERLIDKLDRIRQTSEEQAQIEKRTLEAIEKLEGMGFR